MASRKPAKNQKTERQILRSSASAVAVSAWRIPPALFSYATGFLLLPMAFILTQTFFKVFSKAAADQEFWMTEEFWFFSLGTVLWLIAFFGGIWATGGPVPLIVYIFGHELTHAIWVWLMLGRVRKFKVESDGGYIVTDRHNFWIALAPYFYPVYSIAVILLFGGIGLFRDLSDPQLETLGVTPFRLLFLALGVTWAFHMSFTCWMIPKGQSDLTSYGTFFSLVVIYIMNLAVLSAFLVVAAPHVTWRLFATDLIENGQNFYSIACRGLAYLLHRAISF